MEISTVQVGEQILDYISINTVIVGSGAAGYNAADSLFQNGQSDIAVVTDHRKAGTSRNTGSDKQTYYKLSLCGDSPDSVSDLAQVFFQGGCVDGDLALCEAALSAQGFYKLVGLGVPFPKNTYGEYVGYKTDHDPSKRATSVGPYTSKIMTERLEQAVIRKGIPLFDHHQVIRILIEEQEGRVLGLLCLNTSEQAIEGKSARYCIFSCKNVVYATGGPAGMYVNSVYPHSQFGASGLAFEVGVKGKNLTEWQYGMASVNPRWNVSGTYMQVLPRFISTDEHGENPREFLLDFFKNQGQMMSKIFLKGYQWPFDVRKIQEGSSIIDVLVYRETTLNGRRVFLDFRSNPMRQEIDYSVLEEEARNYLEQAGACFGTPYERLCHMNQPAVDFYLDKGVDLAKEPLEITLCAQHNNGGLAIDKWWQTNLQGFFAVGEVAGSHGIYRPGGSALNAGQVGSARAAEYIAAKNQGEPLGKELFVEKTMNQIQQILAIGNRTLVQDTLEHWWEKATKRMSLVGAAIRNLDAIKEAVEEVEEELKQFNECVQIARAGQLWKVYQLRNILISQFVYLNAMLDYINNHGKSRGSALYTCKEGILPDQQLSDIFRFQLEDDVVISKIQEVTYSLNGCSYEWRKCRPLPQKDDFFENVWKTFRENGNID